MTDFDYDVLQKKRTAHSAFHKKCGARSKRCTLPSDYLSPSELKRRNGPMKEYKLNAPMNWKEFTAMPEDLQQQYIISLREKYNTTDAMLSEMCVGNLSATFTGEFDPTRFWALLTKLPIPTGNVRIRIEVSRE